ARSQAKGTRSRSCSERSHMSARRSICGRERCVLRPRARVQPRANASSVQRRKPRQKTRSSAATVQIELSPSESFNKPSRSFAIVSSRLQTSVSPDGELVSPDGDMASRQPQPRALESRVSETVPAVAAAVLARLDVAAQRDAVDLFAAEVVEAGQPLQL